MRPGDIERLKEVAKTRPCGTRSKYSLGCRCDACRKANTAYEQQRQAARKAAALAVAATGAVVMVTVEKPHGSIVRAYKRGCPGPDGKGCPHNAYLRKDSTGGVCARCREKLSEAWNGLVPADEVLAHLRKLRKEWGIGFKTAADAAGVAQSVCGEIWAGRKKQLRAQTARKLLAVDGGAATEGTRIPSRETWKKIRYLLRNGWTHPEINEALGYARAYGIQIGKPRCTALNAWKVDKLYREHLESEKVQASLDEDGEVRASQEERLKVLARIGSELTASEIVAEYGHLWKNTRTLRRDRKLLDDRKRIADEEAHGPRPLRDADAA